MVVTFKCNYKWIKNKWCSLISKNIVKFLWCKKESCAVTVTESESSSGCNSCKLCDYFPVLFPFFSLHVNVVELSLPDFISSSNFTAPLSEIQPACLNDVATRTQSGRASVILHCVWFPRSVFTLTFCPRKRSIVSENQSKGEKQVRYCDTKDRIFLSLTFSELI